MTKKTLSGLCSALLAVVVGAGVCCAGYASRNDDGKWFKNSDISTWHWADKSPAGTDNGTVEINNGGKSMQLSGGETRGAKFNARALNTSEYWEYELDTQSVESAHVATVTLANHSFASDNSITLSAEFTDSYPVAQKWKASDYIKFSSTTVQSGEEFTISCLQSFRYPITIKATANGSVSANDGSKAYCTVRADYITRFKMLDFQIGGTVGSTNGSFLGSLWIPLVLEGEDPIVTEVYTDTEMYLWETFDSQGLEAILIDTAIDDDDYLEFGTITEGVKDVHIWTTSYGRKDPLTAKGDTLSNDLSKYDVDMPDYPLFFMFGEEKVNSLWDYCQMDFEHYAGNDYAEVLENYNKKKPTSTLWVQFTGEKSGIVYTFKADLIVNPKYMYVPAQGPTFDPDTSGGIIF